MTIMTVFSKKRKEVCRKRQLPDLIAVFYVLLQNHPFESVLLETASERINELDPSFISAWTIVLYV